MQQMTFQEEDPLTGTTWRQRPASASGSGRSSTLRLVGLGLLLVGLLAATSAAIGLAVRLQAVKRSCPPPPQCMHALGGGPVAPGGSIKGAAPAYCRELLAGYADPASGAYWQEVAMAAAAMMQVFGFPGPSDSLPAGHQQQQHQQAAAATGGFTARSLLQQQQQQQAPAAAVDSGGVMQLGGPQLLASSPAAVRDPFPAPDKKLLVVFDIDETVLSNMQQILHPDEWPWDKWVAAAAAPPLVPVLRFYEALCRAGYSVAFVTGRREAARQQTADNLAAAGYGSLCQPNAARAGNSDSTADGSSSNSNAEKNSCCYEALVLREANDTRLASVYKPAARRALTAGGRFTLLALVGDQFSDINGQDSAPYAFKLPNPFYYIL